MPPIYHHYAVPEHAAAPPAGDNEWQRWQHTFDARAPVVSAANLLLVFLLKLNRVLVPALIRWMRTRRLAWIKRADVDVARELLNYPNRRQLCAGACCRDTYGTFNDTDNYYDTPNGTSVGRDPNCPLLSKNGSQPIATPDDADAVPRKRPSAMGTMLGMMQSWVSAFEADDTDSDDSDVDGSRRRAVYRTRLAHRLAARTDNAEEDIYYRLRVRQETRHREMFVGQFNYSEVMAMYVTLWSLIIYSAVIITFVLYNFEFAIREAWFFSVSLITTGITSEIDTLVMFQRRVRAGKKHMLPEMPGYYALQSVAERAKLAANGLMDGVERGVERLKNKKKGKKAGGRKKKARRGPEVLPVTVADSSDGELQEKARRGPEVLPVTMADSSDVEVQEKATERRQTSPPSPPPAAPEEGEKDDGEVADVEADSRAPVRRGPEVLPLNKTGLFADDMLGADGGDKADVEAAG